MKKVLSFVFALVIAFSCMNCVFAAGTKQVSLEVKYRQTEARSMFGMINDLRTSGSAWYWNKDNSEKIYCGNLPALEYDYELEQFAMQRAAELIVSYSHTRPDGTLSVYGYEGNIRAENIALGFSSAKSVQSAFEEADKYYSDQGHRRNMLHSGITAVGLACVEYKGVKYWVQEFRNPVGSAAQTPANDSVTSVTLTVPEDWNEGNGNNGGGQPEPENPGNQELPIENSGNWFEMLIGFFRMIINFFTMLAGFFR